MPSWCFGGSLTPLGFPFGLGKGDEVVLLDAADTVVDSYAYEATAPLSDWSRCADGGDWAHATEVTLGTANVCDVPAEPGAVLLNEIDSGPADWIELINPGNEPLDLSGYELRDNSDDHRWFFADGASIAAGARLVVEASTPGVDVDGAVQQFTAAIGIGGTDAIRLYDDAGTEASTRTRGRDIRPSTATRRRPAGLGALTRPATSRSPR